MPTPGTSVSALRYMPKRNKSYDYKKTSKRMVRAGLIIIAQSLQPKCPGMEKSCCIYTIDYYRVIQINTIEYYREIKMNELTCMNS